MPMIKRLKQGISTRGKKLSKVADKKHTLKREKLKGVMILFTFYVRFYERI